MRIVATALASALFLVGCSADAGGSPSPGASQVASASVHASASDSATPTGQPTPTATPTVVGILPPDSVAAVVVYGLRVRDAPSVDGNVLHVLDAGSQVMIIGNPNLLGPVRADGEEWYQVVYPVDYEPGSEVIGFAAAGPPSGLFLAVVEPICGGRDLESVAALTGYGRLVCFGTDELTFEGTYACECGGLAPGTFEPVWLAHPIAGLHVFQVGIIHNPDGSMDLPGRMSFSMDPALGLPTPPAGSIIRVVGQFDHPAAADCSIAAGPEGAEVIADPRAAVAYCREKFVVRSLEVIGSDPSWAPAGG